MHTLKIILSGLALLGVFLLAGRWLFGAGWAQAAKYFLPLWLVAALANMWVGVTQAGYTVADETPILLAVFGIPAAVALLAWWKFAPS